MTAVKFALAGGVGGLAWAGALRAFMAELAGHGSRVEWVGTFAQVLLPGVLIGVLLGVAEHLRRTGGRRGWRWLAAAPALFAIAPLVSPGAVVALLTTGIGGGALAVPLTGVLGGFAVSGRGPRWGRIVAGVPAAALVAGGAIAPFALDTWLLTVDAARGVWIALLFASISVIFAFACSIPHRRIVAV